MGLILDSSVLISAEHEVPNALQIPSAISGKVEDWTKAARRIAQESNS